MSTLLSRREQLALFQEKKRQQQTSKSNAVIEKPQLQKPIVAQNKTVAVKLKNPNNKENISNRPTEDSKSLKRVVTEKSTVEVKIKHDGVAMTEHGNRVKDSNTTMSNQHETKDNRLQSLLGINFASIQDSDSDDEDKSPIREKSIIHEQVLVSECPSSATTLANTDLPESIASSVQQSPICKAKIPKSSSKSSSKKRSFEQHLPAMEVEIVDELSHDDSSTKISGVKYNNHVESYQSSTMLESVPEGIKGRKQTRVNFTCDDFATGTNGTSVTTTAKTPTSKLSKKPLRKPTPHHSSHPSSTGFTAVMTYSDSPTSDDTEDNDRHVSKEHSPTTR